MMPHGMDFSILSFSFVFPLAFFSSCGEQKQGSSYPTDVTLGAHKQPNASLLERSRLHCSQDQFWINELTEANMCCMQIQGKDRTAVAEAGRRLSLDGTYIARSYIEQVTPHCFTSLGFASLYFTSFTPLHFIPLHFTSIHTIRFTSVHFTSLDFTTYLHITSHHFISLHVTCPVGKFDGNYLIKDTNIRHTCKHWLAKICVWCT